MPTIDLPITGSNQTTSDVISGHLRELDRKLDRVIADHARMEAVLRGLLEAFAAGGARGFRSALTAAAKNGNTDGR